MRLCIITTKLKIFQTEVTVYDVYVSIMFCVASLCVFTLGISGLIQVQADEAIGKLSSCNVFCSTVSSNYFLTISCVMFVMFMQTGLNIRTYTLQEHRRLGKDVY